MKHVTWSFVTLVIALTILSACSSTPAPRHDSDKTRSHADDAQRDLEHEEEKQR